MNIVQENVKWKKNDATKCILTIFHIKSPV